MRSKSKKKLIMTCSLIALLCSSVTSYASGWGVTGNVEPTANGIILKPDYQQKKGYDYGEYEYIKTYKEGQYGIYSPIHQGDKTPWNTYKRYIKENRQKNLGKNGQHLRSKDDYNVKKGSRDPVIYGREGYKGDGTGTDYYPNNERIDHRFMGYTKDGLVVDNPYFPADIYGGIQPHLKKWQTFPQVAHLNHAKTQYNNDKDNGKAKRTFETWFETTEIGAKFRDVARSAGNVAQGEEWAYWNERLAILTDIDDGAGVLRGWHKVIIDGKPRLFYEVFAIPKPPETNIAISKLQLIDKETDKVVLEMTRNVDETNPMKQFQVDRSKYKGVVERKVYKARAEYSFYADTKLAGFETKKTKTGKIELDRHISTSGNINNYNSFSYEYKMEDGKGLNNIEGKTELKHGEKAVFEWDFEIPKDTKGSGSLYVKLSPIYNKNKDDFIVNDNWLNVVFELAENDIGFRTPVELTNSNGKKVNYVYPSESHTVTFNVGHFGGKEAVGLNPKTNPLTTIDVVITDGGNNQIINKTYQAKDILQPGGTIKIDVPNVNTEYTSIKACAIINKVHKDLGYNSVAKNDTICQTFASAKNYSVKDLKANPQAISIPEGVNKTRQVVNFVFTVGHEGEGDYGDSPVVVLRQNGRELTRANISVPAGKTVTQTWPWTVDMNYGDNNFEVEVNPAPRQITEFRSTGENPYADNKKTTSVNVRRNPKCINCDKGKRTRNTWSEIFDMHEHIGHLETFTSCSKKRGCRTYQRCVTDSDTYWTETPNFYEEYKITNVFFRSKWSKDTQGGDGWVDLLRSKGKIKSGYGFELKIITNYKTNRGSIPPVPNEWRRGCSYLSRSPGIGQVENPNIISLKMPYRDSYGNNVCYILTPTQRQGGWTNSTKTFELPLRDVFTKGKPQERKIFINESAKAQKGVKMEINTQAFEGYIPDAPYNVSNKRTLQDCVTVEFEILANDDLKTHIVQ